MISSSAGVIETAKAKFPELDECEALILRSGRFCSHGSTLEQFLDRLEGDADQKTWWDRAAATAEVLRSAEFRAGFRKWLAVRRDWVIDRFTEECERSEGLNLARAINVSRNWRPTRRPLGIYWAFRCVEDLSPHWARGNRGVDVSLYGSVAVDAVNWRETLLSRIDYFNGDDECEVQLVSGAMVALTRIEGIEGLSLGNFRA